MGKLRDQLFYGGLTKRQYQHIREEIYNYNKDALCKFLPILVWIFFGIIILNAFFHFENEQCQMIFILTLVALLLLALLVHFVLDRTPHFLKWYVYSLMIIFYFMSIAQAMVQPRTPCVSFVVLLIGLPISFTDQPIKQMIIGIVASLIYIILSYRFEVWEIAIFDTTEIIMFLIISMVTSYSIMKQRFYSFYSSYHIAYLSHTDLLTGIKNRNCYEKEIVTLEKMHPERIVCIYCDADGLHTLNNTQGHEAGDRMLIEIAQNLKGYFGEDNTYRLGGDEFIGIKTTGEISQIHEDMALIAAGLYKKKVHISWGMAVGKGDYQLLDVIRKAEKEMYVNKKDYYSHKEYDRRQASARV